MSATLWNTCAKPGLTLEALKKYRCWVGVDLAEVRDIAALALLFKLSGYLCGHGPVLSAGGSCAEIPDRADEHVGP
jgi:phage terminase large subunit-like protein